MDMNDVKWFAPNDLYGLYKDTTNGSFIFFEKQDDPFGTAFYKSGRILNTDPLYPIVVGLWRFLNP